MKKLVLLLCALALAATSSIVPSPSAVRAATVYALVTASDAVLLREPTAESIENTYFTLPRTYFVTLVVEHYTDTLHKVRYRDMVGYVRAEHVELVDYTPASVYPDAVTLRVHIDASGVNVRSRPDHNGSDVVYSLPQTASGIEYYGTAAGTSWSSLGNAWYYVKIEPGSDSVIRGYVYAPYVMLETTIPPINDTSPITTPELDVPVIAPVTDGNETTDPIRIIAVIALCVPAVALVCIIFSRPRKKRERKATYQNDSGT